MAFLFLLSRWQFRRRSPGSCSAEPVRFFARFDDVGTVRQPIDECPLEAAGGTAVMFSWLKTVNSDFYHMQPDPPLNPFQPNIIASEPPSVTCGYHQQVIAPGAPDEIREILEATTVRSITEQIQLVSGYDVLGTVGFLGNHRFYRGFFKYCHRKHLHQCVE